MIRSKRQVSLPDSPSTFMLLSSLGFRLIDPNPRAWAILLASFGEL